VMSFMDTGILSEEVAQPLLEAARDIIWQIQNDM
jgi:hypothetical protein